MPREVYNSDPAMADLRKQGYVYANVESYVRTFQALIVGAEGGELHDPSGKVTPLFPGDWVLEFPTGELVRVPAAVFPELYRICPDQPADLIPEDQRKTKRAAQHDLQEQGAQHAPPDDEYVEPPEADPVTAFIPPAGYDADAQATYAAQAAAATREPPEPITEAQRSAVLEDARIYQGMMKEENVKAANKAVEDGLIDDHERFSWINTGELPRGVSVTKTIDGSYEITRDPDAPEDVDADESELEVEAPAPPKKAPAKKAAARKR
jgi:hypothetical protein